MKKIKNVFIIAILAVLSFSMVSCENENIGIPASVSEVNDLNASQVVNEGLIQTRSGDQCYPEDFPWEEASGPLSFLGEIYSFSTKDAYPLSGVKYKFRVYNHTVGSYFNPRVFVKTYSPTGVVRFTEMQREHTSYKLYRTFDEDGMYYYRYFAKAPTQDNVLIQISDSKSFEVKHPSLPVTINNNPTWVYGELLGTVNGVEIRCNSNKNLNPYGGINQCTEFCKRYYKKVYGINWNHYGHASSWYTDYNRIWGVVRHKNGTIRPRPGDILCMSGGNGHSSGHVAIIIEVGDTYIKIAQQNSGKSSNGPWMPIGGNLNFNKNSNIISPPDSYYTIQGVLRKPV